MAGVGASMGKRERGCGCGSARGLLGELGAGCPILPLLALYYVLNMRKEIGRRKEKGEEKEKEGKEKIWKIFQT
jgi:hypothetical protein